MQIERALCAKRPNTIPMLTDQLLDTRVDHEKVVYHLLMMSTIDSTDQTQSLAFVAFDVTQQVGPEFVVDGCETLEADAASLWRRSGGRCRCRGVEIDLDVDGFG